MGILVRISGHVMGAALLGAAACGSEPTTPTVERPAPIARPRPNIIVVMADDLGYGDLSSYGGWIDTPALDTMAAEGIRFTDFHSSGAVCSPTRAGLLTGRYQQRAGLPDVIYANPAWNRHHGLQAEETTIAEMLQDEGYATGVVGKWHLGYDESFNPTRHGFDRFRGYVSGNIDYMSHVDGFGFHDWWTNGANNPEEGYVTHLVTDHAVRFIEEQTAAEQPFFLYVSHEAPHFPYQGPLDPAFRVVGQQIPETRRPAQVERAYREMVEEMDSGIGVILKTLEKLNIDGRTLVFFLSDNGARPEGSNGPLRGFKASVWEGGHRVPAIAWWPGVIASGATSDAVAISLDVAATVLDVADVIPPSDRTLDGVSLLPHLFGGAPPTTRMLFWSYQPIRAASTELAVRDGGWKLVVDGNGQPGIALYNLTSDQAETVNLATDEPARVATMRDALKAWQADVAANATPQPPPAFSPATPDATP